MSSIENLFQQSQLAQAAYADFVDGVDGDGVSAVAGAEDRSGGGQEAVRV